MSSRRRGTLATAGLLVAGLAGCADRSLTRRPDPPPETATWLAVWAAVLLAVVVLAGLLLATRPDRRRPPGVPGVVLAAQAASTWVLFAVGVGVAIRGSDLAGQPLDERPVTLLRLPAPDGDTGFYGLLLVGIVVVVGLPALLLTLSTRFCTSPVRIDRWLAVAVLALEVGLGALAIGGYLLDLSRTWPITVLAINLVPSTAALLAPWPPLPDRLAGRVAACR